MLAALDPSLLTGLLLAAFFAFSLGMAVFALSRPRPQHPPAPGPEQPPSWGQWLLLAAFVGAWITGAAYLDFIALRAAVGSCRALSFAPVEGQVLTCTVIEVDEAYDIAIEYAYPVGGQDFRGSRIRYGKFWGPERVRQFVAAHPPQTPVTVYHDPTDPADAVLLRDVDGSLPWLFLFLTPFNLVAVFLAGSMAQGIRSGGKASLAVTETDTKARLRLASKSTAIRLGLFVLLGGALVAAVLVGLCCGVPPPLAVVAAAWTIVLTVAVLAYGRTANGIAAGRFDLVIDRAERMLTLPVGLAGTPSLMVPIADITAIEVVTEMQEESTRHVPTVRWRDRAGAFHEAKVA